MELLAVDPTPQYHACDTDRSALTRAINESHTHGCNSFCQFPQILAEEIGEPVRTRARRLPDVLAGRWIVGLSLSLCIFIIHIFKLQMGTFGLARSLI